MIGENIKAKNLRVEKGVEKKKSFEIEFDGGKIVAFEGETIATALLAAGKRIFRKTNKKKDPRGIYCGTGICYECRMIVNGKPNVRVCQTMATPDCKVQTQIGLENWRVL
jgi:hypothetical protein